MPIPLILAAVEMTTLLEGLGVITTGAVAIALSPDNDEVQKKIDDKIREYESVASGGGIGVIDGDEDSNGNRSGGAAGAVAGATIGVAAIESTTNCKKCPAIGKVGPHKQSIEGWSAASVTYQQRICSTTTGHDGIKNYINEYKCQGVAFDGWRETECLFLEAKGKYDNFFKSNGKVFFENFSGFDSIIAQASRHQVVMEALQKIPFCHWHFMQPKSASYFKFEFAAFSNLKVFHTP
ncbi:restriction endonuclease fold toxin 5 domain-containing protein [Providencia stuartii]|uniref:restriction endonuclease fold toxin 5 domain-containing protein n=1 Tax=Providencia stuartii TaxID=588 RepID=UPI001B520422|nr:restriction endonuclease fold toxin 5 domain-containing protein [Providencia stuartii]MBQ0695269.1 restriction endonuclease fold toxin 5 domain-containing protein [Providencia stuartii]